MVKAEGCSANSLLEQGTLPGISRNKFCPLVEVFLFDVARNSITLIQDKSIIILIAFSLDSTGSDDF